ncbi:MAG: PBECR4 domain-containing protein [Clostridia bacterium]|nr:PBECR4 domain-containing protein [Clostridia bacterium]
MAKCKNVDIKSAIKIVTQAAKEYEENLNDRHFMVVYQEEAETKIVYFGFRDFNFLHLTGVNTTLKAKQFYKACLEHKLAGRDIIDLKKGKTQQKLAVIPYLSKILYNNCMIGYSIQNGIYLQADYFVGNTKAVLSVGFRFGENVDYPVTLYNGDVRKMIKPACKVLAIFTKRFDDKKYNQCTYLSKGQQIGKLKLDDAARNLLEEALVRDSVD